MARLAFGPTMRFGIVLSALLVPLAASAGEMPPDDGVIERLVAPEGEAAPLAPSLSPAARRRLKMDVTELAAAALAADSPQVDIALDRCLTDSRASLDQGRTQPLIACFKSAVDGLREGSDSTS
ncbi:MAG: hypothetical protein KDG89_06205 [Geminicoccaceae bacterium]|nr:hypothetical protein [Geminicoccaceae bacterium]